MNDIIVSQHQYPRMEQLAGAAGFLSITAGSAVVAYFDPAKDGVFPLCPLFAITGLACPGCGLTRGFHALFHGDVLTALDFNALLPVWAAIIFWVWLSCLVLAVRGKGLPMWATEPKFLYGFGTALLVFGVLRNIPAYPFSVLFP
jgi:hypothetical protein